MNNVSRRCILAQTPKKQKHQTPTWLEEAVYEPKRQHTFDVVKQAIDLLVEQRKLDGSTRISLSTITVTTRQLDPAGKGVAHTTILEHEEAYAYYRRYRTAEAPKKRQEVQSTENERSVIQLDRDQAHVRQRYRQWTQEELVDHLNASRQGLRGNDRMGKRAWTSEEKEAMCDSPNYVTPSRCSNPDRAASAI